MSVSRRLLVITTMVFYNDDGNRLVEAFRKQYLMENEVVAGIAHNKGNYLVGRKFEPIRNIEVWEFPGGKIEKGELVEEATRREWLEELSVELARFDGVICTLENEIHRIHFCAVEIRGTPRAIEHLELSWKTPEELALLPMHSFDAEFVTQYLINCSGDFAGR